ncbi:YchJ family protein [Corynebacterium mendelii]|uniref:SEC-C domain-containing protein n=1 Tax=Corynebacterium mendelii TaxID=2765362 RepID=A0A939IXD7_9CORY|nr:YchJ family metal-binding protein [Corynebacterium mendelii]MBN9643567.1 SEC-C domain-containing protein [Corynebacterium mendelii]
MSFSRPTPADACPCCSGLDYADCCQPILDGAPAASPEALMRSRYTAFCTGRREYLLKSWHPSTRPGSLELDPDRQFTRLIIHDSSFPVDPATPATVWFTAVYRTPAGKGRQCEKSVFLFVDGNWTYLGEAPPAL